MALQKSFSSGTYTPTVTAGTNVAATTARACYWHRINNIVSVTGAFNADVTSAAVASSVTITLPIPSSITGTYDLSGPVTSVENLNRGYALSNGSNAAEIGFINATSTGNETYVFSFSYIIK